MPDLVTRLRLANQDFNKNIDSSKQKVKELQSTADDADKSIKAMGSEGAKSAQDLLKSMQDTDKGARAVSNYRRQLADLQKQITDLTLNYRAMTAEQQQSAKGLEIKALLQEATQQAAAYKDAIGDVQQEIKNLASDTAVWDGLKEGIDVASSALQSFVATGVLGEKSTEKLVEVIAKLKAVEAGTNAVIKVGNALQKNSALIQGICTLQSKALAKAKDLETAATGRATIAQKLFNVVANANPYVLLATAVIAVGAALLAFTKKANDAGNAAKTAAKAMDDYNNKMKEAQGEAGKTVAKFKILENQYKSLKTEGEKQKWIKENAEKFKELGMKIDDVNDADDTFIKNADKVIRAMQLRAQAAAALSVYEEKYAEAYKKSLELQDKEAKKGGGMTGPRQWKKAGLKEGEDYKNTPITMQSSAGAYSMDNWQLTESGRKKMEEYGKQAGEAYRAGVEEGLQPIINDIQTWTIEAEQLESQVAGYRKAGNDNNNNGPKKEKELVNQLDKLKKQKSELEDQLKYIQYGTDDWKKQLEAINEVDKAIAKLEDEQKAYLASLNRKQLQKLELPVTIKVPNKIELPKAKLQVDLEPKGDKMKRIYDEAKAQADRIKDWFDVGAISAEMAKKMIAGINDRLERQGIKAKVDVEIDDDSIKRMIDSVSNLDKVTGIANSFVGSINSIYEAISGLSDKLEDAENGWEQFFAVFQTGITVMSSLATIIDTVATVTEVLNAVKAKSAAASIAETAATNAEAAAHTTNAGAKAAEAIAGASNSAASIPVVGWVLAGVAAVTLLATLLASMKSAKGFAGGGIVDSNLMHGDKNIVRVNGGEMILNTQQQKNLFRMLDEGRTEKNNLGGHVEFKIRGTELIGVLDNYTNKRSKI